MAVNKWFFCLAAIVLNGIFMTYYTSSSLLNNYVYKNLLPKNPPKWPREDTEKIILQKIEHRYQNLPLKYFLKRIDSRINMYYKNESCASFPNILEFNYENDFWQTDKFDNTTMHFYSAFFDIRYDKTIGSCVRILAMVNKQPEVFPGNTSYYCQIWYEDEREPTITKVGDVDIIWRLAWKFYNKIELLPYLIQCPMPKKWKIPKAVSLVQNQCDNANNLLKVQFNKPFKQKMFAVCVKGLDFLQEDLSIRLIEWIELLFILGVDKIFFYQLQVHPNIRKLLDYYKKLGKVGVRDLTLPPSHPNIPYIQHMFIKKSPEKKFDELIPYNDCFYRNLYSYRYVVLLDVDEIIIPTEDDNWIDLIKQIQKKLTGKPVYASYNYRNAYFIYSMQKDIPLKHFPPYLHMLQNVHRSKLISKRKWFVKTFFDTKYVITCHNHLPIKVYSRTKASYDVEPEFALMHHYRKSCQAGVKCDMYENDTVEDITIWKFKDELLSRTNKVIYDLQELYTIENIHNGSDNTFIALNENKL